jgi:hypothetical protein
MPPPEAHRTLSAAQKETLRRWIAEGAAFSEHWAFTAPNALVLPEVKHRQWVRTPIDRFVVARLETEGMAPSPEADRERLLRRVTLDLTSSAEARSGG